MTHDLPDPQTKPDCAELRFRIFRMRDPKRSHLRYAWIQTTEPGTRRGYHSMLFIYSVILDGTHHTGKRHDVMQNHACCLKGAIVNYFVSPTGYHSLLVHSTPLCILHTSSYSHIYVVAGLPGPHTLGHLQVSCPAVQAVREAGVSAKLLVALPHLVIRFALCALGLLDGCESALSVLVQVGCSFLHSGKFAGAFLLQLLLTRPCVVRAAVPVSWPAVLAVVSARSGRTPVVIPVALLEGTPCRNILLRRSFPPKGRRGQ